MWGRASSYLMDGYYFTPCCTTARPCGPWMPALSGKPHSCSCFRASAYELLRLVRARHPPRLPYVPADRIIIAPDRGMKYIPRDTNGKMKAMADAAQILRARP